MRQQVIAAMAMLVALVTASQAAEPVNDNKLQIGGKVPDFTVADQDGNPLRLGEIQKDRKLSETGVTVLTFWCSFCHSCRHIEGDLDRLAKAYRGKAAVFALDASAGETAEIIADAVREYGLTVPVLLDESGRTAVLFGTERTTTTVVIDGKGVLRYRGQFGHGRQTFAEDALKAVLAGKDVPLKETPHRG